MLDSGTTRRHPLIGPALHAADQHAWDIAWTVEDTGQQWRGHGTQMSGLSLSGDLTPHLSGSGPVALTHRLESVKILSDRGANDPALYGYVTATAVSRAEIQAPERRRAFCLAVTSYGPQWRGRPTSWSAKIDDLAYGDGADQRLIVVSYQEAISVLRMRPPSISTRPIPRRLKILPRPGTRLRLAR